MEQEISDLIDKELSEQAEQKSTAQQFREIKVQSNDQGIINLAQTANDMLAALANMKHDFPFLED